VKGSKKKNLLDDKKEKTEKKEKGCVRLRGSSKTNGQRDSRGKRKIPGRERREGAGPSSHEFRQRGQEKAAKSEIEGWTTSRTRATKRPG